jgi:hypothetical protein
VLSLSAADVAYSVYAQPGLSAQASEADQRLVDSQAWVGEVYPRLYYPTDRNFRLHKPNTLMRAILYGGFYRPDMKRSKTLTESVLEAHAIEIAINADGFRDDKALSDATVLALGDSLTFGWGVNVEESWTGRLNRSTTESVYNLGVHDSSPRQELMLLDYLLRQQGRPPALKSVVCMIYEGNDLEDDYSDLHTELGEEPPPSRFAGTVLDLMTSLPGTVRDQAVLTRLRTGRIAARLPPDRARHEVDGVSIDQALYHSANLGSRLFLPRYIERAQADLSYVRHHPNRLKLEQTLDDMAALAREFRFDVSLVLVPTAARLHGPLFDGFPSISPRPYFLDFLVEQANVHHFEVLDLYEALAPLAPVELLYFRDDDHLNRRGNQVVAGMIRQRFFPGSVAPEP